MKKIQQNLFTTLRTEGGLLPADLLQRLRGLDKSLIGIRAEDYRLLPSEKLNEAASRAWTRLLGAWHAFQALVKQESNEEVIARFTRDRWLLVLFNELDYGRMPKAEAFQIEGFNYPISHFYHKSPIHLLSWSMDLDKRNQIVHEGVRTSPHSLVQEFLNRSNEHLWGFVSNGKVLRILRDNISLTRQAFVEFDLVAMFEGEAFSDFLLLWLLCHQSRIEAEKPEDCWLEQWSKVAQQEGTRALEQLRQGVETAISSLGAGFLASPANQKLREDLRQGLLSTQDYYRQLLRLVYRLLFLFVAEDRELLLVPEASEIQSDRYLQYYSTKRLRLLADQTRGTPHPDMYEGLKIVMGHLGQNGCEPLGLPALGSFLWSIEAIPDLYQAQLSNQALLKAVFALAYTVDGKIRRSVDYKNLGSEELGSIYESLLELHPEIHAEAATFELKVAAGNERKTTGSYYTPTSLITCLLDSALDPVIEQAIQGKSREEAEAALLNLKICDPACGSGHFLIAAAHRLAKHLASARTGDAEPTPTDTRHALRDVIGRCIYGVDINPMSVELCKVSLWMDALEPGKPLSFLDHHIQCGNALIGATPELIEKGIPDEAFTAIEGDDKAVCSAAKKENKAFHNRQMSWLDGQVEFWSELGTLGPKMLELDLMADDSISGVQAREAYYRELQAASAFQLAKMTADAWCAAFVWKKVEDSPPITGQVFWQIKRNPHTLTSEPWRKTEIERLAEEYQFFHWHLEFPEVFYRGKEEAERAGFDVVLGNPPWERVKMQEQEFFASRSPEIAQAANAAARKHLIAALPDKDPALFSAYLTAKRQAEGDSHFIRQSGKYPLCGRGDVNTYTIFTELNRTLINGVGRVGCIVPSGIATDDTTKFFFQDLIETNSLVSFYSFFEIRRIFIDTDSRGSFCLMTMAGLNRDEEITTDFMFFADSIEELNDKNRHFSLSANDIALINPNTKTCPVFRSSRDAEITKAIYRRVPVLIREAELDETPSDLNPWGTRFSTMLHMSNDSNLFRTRAELLHEDLQLQGNRWFRAGSDSPAYLPLYEAKMVHHFDHRFGDYTYLPEGSASTQLPNVPLTRLQDPDYAVQPRYWVPAAEVQSRLAGKWGREWLLGWRDICRSTDERTVIASILPAVGVGHKFLLFFSKNSTQEILGVFANIVSFCLDYISRQKMGGTSMSYFTMKQLPILPPATYSQPCTWHPSVLFDWLLPRVLELTYTAWDLQPFAQDCGYEGPPFKWDEERRFLLRCELDAAYFHLYGIEREDVDYIMETFPIVKRKDAAKYGDYRTKRLILQIYDAMQVAKQTGEPYQTLLDPPPADPRVAHPASSKATIDA
ncbi:MAG: N-6 DNA methylase [Candidatus Sericytochromatia bacterium]